jgi:hypothetical protein
VRCTRPSEGSWLPFVWMDEREQFATWRLPECKALQIQTYLEQNQGPGLQHLALKTDDIFATLRLVRFGHVPGRGEPWCSLLFGNP